MDLISILVTILGTAYLIYCIIESFLIAKYRKGIKCVIHVNGIRGKSSIVRLIDSGLREFNYKVVSKTTGTIPSILDINNNEVEIKRFGRANIREQIKLLKYAYENNADYLIIECMAVNPILQKVCEENILKANITIISNVREDHIGEMGETKEELALALSSTTPTKGTLIIHDTNEYKDIFEKACNDKNTSLKVATSSHRDCFDTFEDNIDICLKVSEVLNLDSNKFYEGMKKYKHDYGALTILKRGDSSLINGLSINDIDSIQIVYTRLLKQSNLEGLVLLLNSREDRAGRVKSLLKSFEFIKTKKVILSGSNFDYIKSFINKNYKDIEVVRLNKIEELEKEKLIFAIGNIGGIGKEIIEYYKKGGN